MEGATEADGESLKDTLMVAAVDFGTTFSGYAFSFRHDYLKNPLDIKMNQWISNNMISNKTPTIVLLKPNKDFHSFGLDAEKKYTDLVFDDEHKDWFYFKRFKMELYKQGGLNRHLQITAENGKKVPAMTVITMSIKFMKDHLMTQLKTRVHNIFDTDISWILTVPAIWNDRAKQFMREAAIQAGIKTENLMLCLEPEAASIYCQHVPFILNTQKNDITKFREGTSYMVLDIGGGTADITVHEVHCNGAIKELHKAGGGAWGGTLVDSLFIRFLQRVFGREAYQTFISEHPVDNMELERDFELLKRKVSGDPSEKETIRVPPTFIEEVSKAMGGATLSEIIEETRYKNRIKLVRDKLRLEAGIIHEFFSSTAKSLVNYVNELAIKGKLANVNTFVIVGGLSESLILQNTMRKEFPDKSILIPPEPDLAVLRGAVLFGYKPLTITSRVAKMTYGISGAITFDPKLHPESKKIVVEGYTLCKDVFVTFVEVGQTVPINSVVGNKRCSAVREKQKKATFPVYVSTESNPLFVTDDSCSLLGTLEVPLATGNIKDARLNTVFLRMIFGNVELVVEAVDESTGIVVAKTFDCLEC